MPSPAPGRPDVIAFDLLDTLFPLAQLATPLAAAGGDASTLALWLAKLQADGFAIAAAGGYAPFRTVAKASLRTVLPKAKAAARDRVVASLAALDPYPDSGPAMARAVLDTRVVVVTNCSQADAAALLARGGLDAFVETVVSADDMKAWKPRPDPYFQAARAVETPQERVALVTGQPWDIFGGRQARMVTGWCNRASTPFPVGFGKPDVTGANLLEVVENLLKLEG